MIEENLPPAAKANEKIRILVEMMIRSESKIDILLKQEKRGRPKKEVKNGE